MACFKLKWPSTQTDRCQSNRMEGLADKLTVNEEYTEALRTKSYTDMFNKVQDQMGMIRSMDRLPSSSSRPFRIRLADYLFEVRPENLIEATKGTNIHPLVIHYLEASYEASNICELLLGGVQQARANYRIITRAISLPNSTHVFKELSSFANLNNPMLRISSSQYHDLHKRLEFLLERLTVEFKKIQRREKFKRYCKRILGFSIMVSCAAVLIALLVISIHSMVGTVVAPSVLACSLGFAKKRIDLIAKGLRTSLPERYGAQLEVAAKCVFILTNDFDTMSRLVGRLCDEIEHNKAIADMCVRNGKSEVLREVVREFKSHQRSFLEQLEALEEHIYLCSLSINRSRVLVMKEVRGLQQEHN